MFKYLKQLWTNYRIYKQKKLGLAILNKLTNISFNAIIVGGAPRDWFLGTTANDIDVYIRSHGPRHHYYVISKLADLGFTLHDIQGKEDFKAYESAKSLEVILTCDYKGQKVQIMLVSCATEKVIEEFPLSISMISMDKSGEFYLSPEFMLGYCDRTIYMSNAGYKDNDPYVEKIRERFSDWKYYNKWDVVIGIESDFKITNKVAVPFGYVNKE